MKAGVDLSDVQVEKTNNKIIVKTSAVKILSIEIDENSIKVYDETKNIFNQISITDYKTFAKEQKKKVEKEEKEVFQDWDKTASETVEVSKETEEEDTKEAPADEETEAETETEEAAADEAEEKTEEAEASEDAKSEE